MLKKVLVWVHCRENAEDLFLILQTNEERGGFWQPITGSVEGTESIETAALREMREETGLVPLESPRRVSQPYEFRTRTGECAMEFPFLAEIDCANRFDIRVDPREHTAFQWVSFESALASLKHESNARVLREIRQLIKP